MNKRKKIRALMCCSDLETVKGGMVSVVKNLLAYDRWEDTEIVYIPTHVEKGGAAKAVYFAGACCRALGQLVFHKVDVIHLHVSERGSVWRKLLLLRLGRLFGKPVILHHHGADFEPFYRELSPRKQRAVRRFLEDARMNLVLSELIAGQFRKLAPEGRFRVLYNAVPVPEENRYRPQGRLVVTLGRLGQRKGTYDLIDALEKLDPKLPEDIRFCFCGDGEVEQVRQLLQERGLTHRVAHVGWIAGEEKQRLLENCLCHVLPSYREGLPMSILETMALGIPNVATAIASVPEVITSGHQGLLIDPGDVEGLAQALETLCAREELRLAMSKKAYETVALRFSSRACGRSLENIYREVTG